MVFWLYLNVLCTTQTKPSEQLVIKATKIGILYKTSVAVIQAGGRTQDCSEAVRFSMATHSQITSITAEHQAPQSVLALLKAVMLRSALREVGAALPTQGRLGVAQVRRCLQEARR